MNEEYTIEDARNLDRMECRVGSHVQGFEIQRLQEELKAALRRVSEAEAECYVLKCNPPSAAALAINELTAERDALRAQVERAEKIVRRCGFENLANELSTLQQKGQE